MNIKGRIVPPTNLAYFDCQLQGNNPAFSIPITFAIDTGATRTVVSYKDASLIRNLDYDALERYPHPMYGIGGKVYPYVLKDITITFPDSEPPDHQETLDRIIVLKDSSTTAEERRDLFKVSSVIGMDILRNYTISFQGGNEALLYA